MTRASKEAHQDHKENSSAYDAMFRPANPQFVWGNQWDESLRYDEIIIPCRVLALCFAAAMAESGDL